MRGAICDAIQRARASEVADRQRRSQGTALITYVRRTFSVAGPMACNSLPHFIYEIQRAAQTVLGVYVKRTCSRVTSASSALGVLNDYALYKSRHSLAHSLPPKTRSSAIAEGPRDASCQLKSCQLPRNGAETTCTTSSEQIEVTKLEGYSGPMCNKHVHSTITRSSRSQCPIGVINKPTTDRLWILDITCIPTTCCGEIFLSPQCRNCSRDSVTCSLRTVRVYVGG